ncbi:MAG: hypothetical protein PHC70_00190 [Patescibacteria group bacterium]|nr:hypothetical protein [Patescibacteria group bacterium]
MDKKLSPKPPVPRPEPKTDVTEIAHYRDGQIVEIPANDNRTYCVISGSVQRVVTLPGCQGLGPLKLGIIEGKYEGSYWHPTTALRFAQRNGMNIEFVAVGQTVIKKLTNDDLAKDRNQLIKAFASAMLVQSKLVTDTELLIKREFERAEREASGNRSLQSQLAEANEELESLREKSIDNGAEISRLNRELRKVENDRNSALNREKLLLQERKGLKQRLDSEKKKGLGVMQRLIHEMEDLRIQFTDFSHWAEDQRPTSSEIQAGQMAVDPDGMNEALDAVFDAFMSPDESSKPAKAIDSATTDEPFAGGTQSEPPLDVDKAELTPVSPQEGLVFQDDEPYSASSRQTIPFISTSSGPAKSAVFVPSAKPIPLAPHTEAWDRAELQRLASEAEQQSLPPEPVEDRSARPWNDSLTDDVWGVADAPTHVQKKTGLPSLPRKP